MNAKGGLLGRQVELVNYDDQSNRQRARHLHQATRRRQMRPRVSGYATNMVAPAIPVVMQKGKISSACSRSGHGEFHYPKYFSMLPSGPKPKEAFTEGFFQIATAQNPKPQTVAIAAEDAEFSHNAADGARTNVKSTASKRSTTKPIRRTRRTSRRSCAPPGLQRRSRRDLLLSVESVGMRSPPTNSA